ncbi:MAG: hypothetical protein ACR2PK_20105 [Acidimicrobiales bacterium]
MQVRPGQIALMVGGALILISTFLTWFDFGRVTFNAYSGDLLGFTGIFLLVLSLVLLVGTGIRTFAPQVNMPDGILGFTPNEIGLFAGFASFLWGFSFLFSDAAETTGALLCAIGGVVAVVGAVLEMRETVGPAEAPRTI